MPLIEIRQLSARTRLGLWRIDASTGSFRERERQAVQSLLAAMTQPAGQPSPQPTLTVGHEESGKPFLAGPDGTEAVPRRYLSISHTRGYAALLLSDDQMPGVDIEYRSDRVERIASRFIRPDEPAATTVQKLLLWSAKEAVYKLFSADRLQFFDMRLMGMADGLMRVENVKKNIVVDVRYELTDDYVLTYCLLPA